MTSAPALPGVDRAVADVRAAFEGGTRRLALTGVSGAGKTTALNQLQEQLSTARKVVRVSIPHGDDGPVVAIVDAASQLAGIAPDLARCIVAPDCSWDAKLQSLRATLDTHKNDCVLLVDDPVFGVGDESIATIFTTRAASLSKVFLSADCLTVVGTAHVPAGFELQKVVVQGASIPAQFLDRRRWNGLGDSAEILLREGGERLSSYSPAELRLLVALVQQRVSWTRIHSAGWRRKELVAELIRALGDPPALRKVLARLSLLRLPFDETFLSLSGETALAEGHKKILRDVFLFEERDGQYRLPDFVAREALSHDWIDVSERVRSHEDFAAEYARRFAHRANDPGVLSSSIRLDLEAIHHLSEAGSKEVLSRKLWFAEQYDALGRSLSVLGQELKDPSKIALSVEAYERALKHDSEDWYAKHYAAFNLDYLGKEPDRAERLYRSALEQRPQQIWFHGRLVCFLVTTGRLREAREQWNQALERFCPDGRPADAHLYSELHRYVAQLLLYLGRLEFARRVLDDIPSKLARDLPWHAPFVDRLRLLEEAERDETVFPPHIAEASRWTGPHFPIDTSLRIASWSPGRIASVDDEVHIRVAERDQGGKVIFGWLDLKLAQFRRSAPPGVNAAAGVFLEIVRFRGGRGNSVKEKFFIHPKTGVADVGPSWLPPDRYILRASSKAES